MKTIAIAIAVLVALWGAYQFVYRTDYALLGDEYCLRIASNDVLGNPLYGKSCQRSSYANDVEIQHGRDKAGAAFFKFHPVAGKEALCPPVAVIVDRQTGKGVLGP